MAFFKNIFVTALSFLLIIILTISLVGLGLKILLYPTIYKNALEGSGAYTLLEEFEKKGGTGALQVFSDRPAKELGEEIAEKLFAYLRGEIGEDDVTMQLNQSKLRDFYEESARNFTVCRKGQEPYSGEKLVCRPQEKDPSEFLKEVFERKNMTLPSGNTSVKVLDVFDKQGKIKEIKRNVEIFNQAVYGGLLVSLLIILLIVLLERKNIKAAERWIGADLLIIGVVLFAAVFLGSYALTLIPALGSMHAKILPLVANPILERIGFIAFIIFLAACTLFIISFFGKKQQTDQKQGQMKTDRKKDKHQ